MDSLVEYIDMLKAYNAQTNIYSKNAYDRLDFHIRDSLFIAEIIGDQNVVVADLGSGSGLPAVVVSIRNPQNFVVAVESKGRKRQFLKLVKEKLSLDNFEIFEGDDREFGRSYKKHPQFFTAKAFAPWSEVIRIAERLNGGQATLIIPMSKRQCDELPKDLSKKILEKVDPELGTFYYLVTRLTRR